MSEHSGIRITLDSYESFVISRLNIAVLLFESLQSLKIWLTISKSKRPWGYLLKSAWINRLRVWGESLSHSLTHAASLCYEIATFLNDSIAILHDLFDLSLDGFGDCFWESFIAGSPVSVTRSNFVLNGDQLLMARFDAFKQRLPIHDKQWYQKSKYGTLKGGDTKDHKPYVEESKTHQRRRTTLRMTSVALEVGALCPFLGYKHITTTNPIRHLILRFHSNVYSNFWGSAISLSDNAASEK